MDYRRNLMKLAEACSDLVYGGEHGWERVDFDEFVTHVRQALGRGNRCLQGNQDKSKSCAKCGDRLNGHEDESNTLCRWCVTGRTHDKSEKKDGPI